MGRNHDAPRNLRRGHGVRKEKRVIRVLTEGEVTEVEYVNALRRLPQIRERFHLETDNKHGAPGTLVKEAVNLMRKDREIDRCWCLFDVEWPRTNPQAHHPSLPEAIRLAKAHDGVAVAVSNPTFEYWLVLHHRRTTTFLCNEDAESLRHQLDGSNGKALDGAAHGIRYDGAWYASHCATACINAEQVSQRHHVDGRTFPDDNPSSTMPAFIWELGLSQ